MAHAQTISSHHAEWISLLEPTGPFLLIPVLHAMIPQGLDDVLPEVRATSQARAWKRSARFTRACWTTRRLSP